MTRKEKEKRKQMGRNWGPWKVFWEDVKMMTKKLIRKRRTVKNLRGEHEMKVSLDGARDCGHERGSEGVLSPERGSDFSHREQHDDKKENGGENESASENEDEDANENENANESENDHG